MGRSLTVGLIVDRIAPIYFYGITVIATGGTTEAMIHLIESLGGKVVGIVVLMELAGLKGRERIKDYRLESAICYPGN